MGWWELGGGVRIISSDLWEVMVMWGREIIKMAGVKAISASPIGCVSMPPALHYKAAELLTAESGGCCSHALMNKPHGGKMQNCTELDIVKLNCF